MLWLRGGLTAKKSPSLFPKQNLPGRQHLSCWKKKENITSTFSQFSHESSAHIWNLLFIFHRRYLQPDHTQTKNNIFALWLNTPLYSSHHRRACWRLVRCVHLGGARGNRQPSLQGVVCPKPVPSAFLVLNVLKTTGRYSRVRGFSFLWKFPDATVRGGRWIRWKYLNKWGVSFQRGVGGRRIGGALCACVCTFANMGEAPESKKVRC